MWWWFPDQTPVQLSVVLLIAELPQIPISKKPQVARGCILAHERYFEEGRGEREKNRYSYIYLNVTYQKQNAT